MKYLVLDLETTGTNPEVHGIIELSAIYVDDKKLFQFDLHTIAEKDIISDIGAFRVNGSRFLSNKLRETYSIDYTLRKFADWCLDLNNEPMIVLGHNINFDIAFLKSAYSKININMSNLFSYKVIDTHSIAFIMKDLGLINPKSLSLGDIAKEFNIDTTGIHSASADTQITLAVYTAMKHRLSNIICEAFNG